MIDKGEPSALQCVSTLIGLNRFPVEQFAEAD